MKCNDISSQKKDRSFVFKDFLSFHREKKLLWNSKHSKKWIWEYCEIKSKPQKIRKYFFFIHRNHWMIQRNLVGNIYSGKLKMFWQTLQICLNSILWRLQAYLQISPNIFRIEDSLETNQNAKVMKSILVLRFQNFWMCIRTLNY